MKEQNRIDQGITGFGQHTTLTVGIVKNNADPAHHGRLQVYAPSLDGENYVVDDLPWCWYVSPFGGVTANPKVGREQKDISGITAYGMWSIPKNGAQVLIGCLDGNPETRFWIGCLFMPEMNRTLPAGIDGISTEIDESGAYPQTEMSVYTDNLNEAGLGKNDEHFKTRGGYERSVSHPSNKNMVKGTDNGYAPKPHEPEKADSQTHSFTTPGKHYMVFSDVDEYCRIRIRTTEGHQMIFDDTNERIYISTAKGRNWIELDESNGKVYLYSDSKVSIRGKNDINLYSDENINIVANKRVNIRSEERAVCLNAKHDIRLVSTDADIMATASRSIHLKTVNGPKASAVPEEKLVQKPTPGLIYRWAEKGGSSDSSILLDAYDDAAVRSTQKEVHITGKTGVHLRAVSGNVAVQGTLITLKAEGSFITQSVDTIFTSVVHGASFTTPGTGAATPATVAEQATKATVDLVTDHMVTPEHESWTRDEDEAECPTARNKSYQG